MHVFMCIFFLQKLQYFPIFLLSFIYIIFFFFFLSPDISAYFPILLLNNILFTLSSTHFHECYYPHIYLIIYSISIKYTLQTYIFIRKCLHESNLYHESAEKKFIFHRFFSLYIHIHLLY